MHEAMYHIDSESWDPWYDSVALKKAEAVRFNDNFGPKEEVENEVGELVTIDRTPANEVLDGPDDDKGEASVTVASTIFRRFFDAEGEGCLRLRREVCTFRVRTRRG